MQLVQSMQAPQSTTCPSSRPKQSPPGLLHGDARRSLSPCLPSGTEQLQLKCVQYRKWFSNLWLTQG